MTSARRPPDAHPLTSLPAPHETFRRALVLLEHEAFRGRRAAELQHHGELMVCSMQLGDLGFHYKLNISECYNNNTKQYNFIKIIRLYLYNSVELKYVLMFTISISIEYFFQ